ncbi:MAG: hypothetical protein RBR66_04985, partial [Candidatus Izemoplasmatales bacterium]|nr:hypothetical protein [Candidatus Izemoplasmatales bacterium]
YIRNHCFIDNLLYFVSSADLFLKEYEIETGNFQIIYEDETYFVQSYYNDVFIEALKTTTYSTYKAILKYYHDDKEFLTADGKGMDFVNVSGSKLYYFNAADMNITVIADNFMGRSTIYSLDEHEITEVTELHLIKASYSGELTFALVASTTSETALYIYNTVNGLSKVITGDIKGLNSDGINLYFINGESVYLMNLETSEINKIADIGSGSRYIIVINHWLYVSNIDQTSLVRINPVTKDIETLS